MYRLTRNVHLALGLCSAMFLFAYAVSAFEMAHPFLFGWSGVDVETTTVDRPLDATPRAFAQSLMARGFTGDLMKVMSSTSAVTLTIQQPGTTHEVTYLPNTATATIVTERADTIGTLNRLHHVTGTWHDHWVVTAWVWFLGIVSLMLFGIGATGIYMWFKRSKERRWGTIMLALGGGGGLALVVLIRFLP